MESSKTAKFALASIYPEHITARPDLMDMNVSNYSIYSCDDFIQGDVFEIKQLGWTITINNVQNFTLDINIFDGVGLANYKRFPNNYLRNNMENFEYTNKVDREEHRRLMEQWEKEQKAEKKKAKALATKKAKLAKLQAEIAELETE
jgi:hypothetical protein